MSVIHELIGVFNELRNNKDFLTLPGVFTKTVKANAGELLKIVSKFRVSIELIADSTLNADIFVVADVAGAQSITSLTQTFNDFRVGDVVEFKEGGNTYTGTLTIVNGNYIELTGAAIPQPVSYPDATINVTSSLSTLFFKFNFPASSESNNLISDVFGLIPEFQFSNMDSIGTPVNGVAKSPIFWNGGSASAKKTANVNTYEQVYEVSIIVLVPYYEEGQITNLISGTSPSPYDVESPFYATGIDVQSGNDALTKRPFAINRPVGDSIGYLNENFHGGPRQYSLVSVTFEDVDTGNIIDRPEITRKTKVTAVIAANGTTFVTGNPFVFKFSYLPTATAYTSGTNDFNGTWNYESVRSEIDAAPVNGTNIKDVEAPLSGGQISLTATIQDFTADQLLRMFNGGNLLYSVLLEDPLLDPELTNRLNLIISPTNIDKNEDIDGLISLTTDEVRYQFNSFSGAPNFTDLNEWNEGLIKRKIEFDLQTVTDQLIALKEMYVQIVLYNSTTGDIVELQSVSIPTPDTAVAKSTASTQVQLLNTDGTRGFLIRDDSDFNKLTVVTGTFLNPVQSYTVECGVMINWQDWIPLVGAPSDFYDISQPQNGLNKKASNYSESNGYEIRLATLFKVQKNNGIQDIITDYLFIQGVGKVFDYGKDKNITPLFTRKTVYRDKNNNVISLTAIEKESVIVTATWDDGNVKAATNFVANFTLELFEQGTEKSKWVISTEEEPILTNPFEALDGETMLKKDIVAGKYTASCLLNGDKLRDGFRYDISFALYETVCVPVSVNSLIFNGIDEYLDLGTDASLDFERTDPFSVTFWAKTTDLESSFFSRSNIAGSFKGFRLNFESGVLRFTMASGIIGDDIKVRTNSIVLRNGNWNHFTLTYDASGDATGVLMYLNGISIGTVIEVNNLNADVSSTQPFKLGRDRTRYLDGNMDLVHIFNKELTASEVSDIYNDGCTTLAIPPTASGDIVTTLRMGENVTTGGGLLLTVIDEQGNNTATAINMPDTNIDTDVPL